VHASNDTVPPAIASYKIDTRDPVTLPLPYSDRDIPNQQFFESPDLPLTTHVLTINITSNGSPYTLDTLVICSKATNSVAAVLTPQDKGSARRLTPAVIGGIVGGAVVLLLLILGVVLLRRRRQKAHATRTAQSPICSWLQRRTY
jgi:hypothetical protein